MLYHNVPLYVPPLESARSKALRRNYGDTYARVGTTPAQILLARGGQGNQAIHVSLYDLSADYIGSCCHCKNPSGPFKNQAVNFLADLPHDSAWDAYTILVVVDRCTKLAQYVPAKKANDR